MFDEDDDVRMGCYFGPTLDSNYTDPVACRNDGGEWKVITTRLRTSEGPKRSRADATSKAKMPKSARPKTKRRKKSPPKAKKKPRR